MTDTQKELHAGTFHIAFWKSIPLEFIRKEDGQGGYVYSEERIREAAESGMTVLDCQYDDREVRLHYPKEEQEAAAKISNNEEEIQSYIEAKETKLSPNQTKLNEKIHALKNILAE